jgi:hypothetical protein
MPDFSDEQLPLIVDNIPGVGTAQLGNTQCVHDSACIYFGTDIGYAPSVASDERPHGSIVATGPMGLWMTGFQLFL